MSVTSPWAAQRSRCGRSKASWKGHWKEKQLLIVGKLKGPRTMGLKLNVRQTILAVSQQELHVQGPEDRPQTKWH